MSSRPALTVRQREMLEHIERSRGVAHDMLDGDKPFHLEDVAALPSRYRAQFIADYLAHCSANDNHG